MVRIKSGRCGWTVEAHFILIGNVNSKNCVHCEEKNPQVVTWVSLYERYVTVWFGVARLFILGLHFFEYVTSSGMQTCSITGARYKAILEHFVIPESQQRNVIDDIVWMENGAPPQSVWQHKCSTNLQQLHFVNKIIPRNLAVSWRHRFSELPAMDFWF